ncbi:MAG: 3-oxoacyl-[acyl-carrier protein] reductase, partial [uncultured Solirubrobacterales bacterium]
EHPRRLRAHRQGGDRHRRLLRPRRALRRRTGRGRCRRRRMRPPRRSPRGHKGARRGPRAPLRRRAGRRDRRRRLPASGRSGRRRARPRRRARQQRRRGDRRPGDPRGPGAVPPGHRHQPQRQLLDGPGVRARDAARRQHRQHRQRPGVDDGRVAAGGLRLQQGGDHRTHARPRAAVDGPQGDPRQRAGARLLPLGDDRAVPRGLPRPDALANTDGAGRRGTGARRRGGLPGQRRGVVRHGRPAAGRRGSADNL